MKRRILSAILATLMVVSMFALPVSAETIATADGSLVGTVYAPTTNLSWNDPYNDVTRATDDDLNTQWKCVGQNSYTAKTQYFGYYYVGGAVIDSVSFKVGGYAKYIEETHPYGGIRLEVSTDKTNWYTIWEDKEAAYKDQVVTVDASNWDAAVMTDGAVWNYVRVAYGNEDGYCGWDMLQVYDFRVSGEYVVPADAIVAANKFENPLSAPFGVRTNILETPYVVGTDGLNSIGFILKVEGLGDESATMYGIDPVISQTVTVTKEVPAVDEAGEAILDGEGNPVMETVEVEEVKTYSLGWHGNWVWGSCNKGTFNGDGYYMYTVPFNALANDLSMTSKAGDTTISQFNVFRSDMAFNVLGVSEVKEGVTVSLIGICETSVPAGSAFIKDADGTTLLGTGSTAAALDTTWASPSGAKWVKITTVDDIYVGNGAAPTGYGIDKYVDANGNEYAPDDYILGTVNLTAVYGERDAVKYTATVSELVNGQEATVTVKVDDPTVASAGKVTVAVDSTAFECENNVIEYTEIAEDGTIGTITIKVKTLAPSGEYTFALTAEATSAKGDVIPSYENAVVAFESTQQEGLFFEGDVIALNKTQVAEDGTVTAPGGQKIWGGVLDFEETGIGVTVIVKMDGIKDPITATRLAVEYIQANGTTHAGSSWHGNWVYNSGAYTAVFADDGYYYININYNCLDNNKIHGFRRLDFFQNGAGENTNENATVQVLGIVQNNLTPTVKFVNADGSEIASYTNAYTNVTDTRYSTAIGKLLSADEMFALTGAPAPTMPNNEDGSPNLFTGWVDENGNPVDAIYYNQTLYASYTSAYVEYDTEVVVDGDEATLIITGNGPALENVTSGTINVAIDENVFSSDLAVDGVISVDFDLTPEVEVPEEGTEEVAPAALESDILATIVLDIKKLALSGDYDIAVTGTAKDAEGNDIYVKSSSLTVAIDGKNAEGVLFDSSEATWVDLPTDAEGLKATDIFKGYADFTKAGGVTLVYRATGIETPVDAGLFRFYYRTADDSALKDMGSEWAYNNTWISLPNGDWPMHAAIEKDGYYYVYLSRKVLGMTQNGSGHIGAVERIQMFAKGTGTVSGGPTVTNTNEDAKVQVLAVIADNMQPTVNFYNGDQLVTTYQYKYSDTTNASDWLMPDSPVETNHAVKGSLLSAAEIFSLSELAAPTKATDENYIYQFKGWVDAEGNPVDAVYYDMDVYAAFDKFEKSNKLPVEFYDGSELIGEAEVYENDVAIAPETVPARDENATGKFVFKGWALTEGGEAVDLATYPITEATTFYAVYEYVDVTFQVTYVGYNGATIYTETVVRSKDAAYDVVPTKPTDAYNTEMGGGYKYAFSFWGVESVNEETGEVSYVAADLTNVQGDITVHAQFDASLVEEWFTVTFVDKDETVLSEHIVATGEGVTTSVKGNYNGKADEDYWYTFNGWDKDTSVVTEDMTVTIVYATTPVATGANTVIAEGSGTVGTENALVSSDYTYTAPSAFLTLIFDIKGASETNPISIGAIRTQAKNGSDTIDSNNSGNYGKDSVALKEITEDGKYYVTIGHYVMTWVGSDWEVIKSLTIDDDGSSRGGVSAGEGTYDVTAIEGKLEPTVRYYDAEGNWLYTGKHTVSADAWTFKSAKVPTAADIYKGAEIENFEGWVDADGNEVTYVTENMSVYAKVTVVEPEILWGDVNGDGEVNSTDATLLTRYANKWEASTYAEVTNIDAGDVNDDGEINSTDATLLTRYANKWEASTYAEAVNLLANA